MLAPSGPLQGESALSLVFTVVLVTDVLLQLDHVSGTTCLPVCETRKSAAHNSEDNVSDGLQRIVTFLIIAPYKYYYLLAHLLAGLLTCLLLTYLLTYIFTEILLYAVQFKCETFCTFCYAVTLLFIPGDTTSETVTLMEDCLMVLGSLLSNRFEQKMLSFTFRTSVFDRRTFPVLRSTCS